MAVTITEAEVAAAVRVGDSTEEADEITRLVAYATIAVQKFAPDAPDAVHNEAVIRIAGYLYDSPTSWRAAAFANVLSNSGAAAMLLPWRVHRAGVV